MQDIKISGITGNPGTNRLELSIKEIVTGAANVFTDPKSGISDSTRIGPGLIEIGGFGEQESPTLPFTEEGPIIQYWRERF
jgi:hypothetical protein